MWQICLFICLFIQAFRCFYVVCWFGLNKNNNKKNHKIRSKKQQQQFTKWKLNKKQKCSFCIWTMRVWVSFFCDWAHIFWMQAKTSGLWLWLILNLLLTNRGLCVVLWMNLMLVFNLKTTIGGIDKFTWCSLMLLLILLLLLT